MFYLALFIICSVSPLNEWAGDRDSGPTCVVAEKANFATLDQCIFRLRQTLDGVQTKKEQDTLATRIPGPYKYTMSCTVKVDQGMLECTDCKNESLPERK